MKIIAKIPFVLIAFIVLLPLLSGCGGQDDWYDHSSQHNDQRDAYIQHQIESGMDPMDARRLHDRRVWEMNTINMAREGEKRE